MNSIVNTYSVASRADGIPLDTFTPAAASTVLSLFALLGLANLMICLICIVILARYRALVPLMFALLLLQQLGRYLIVHLIPIVRTGTPPASAINLLLLAVMMVGLALSLWSQDNLQAQAK